MRQFLQGACLSNKKNTWHLYAKEINKKHSNFDQQFDFAIKNTLWSNFHQEKNLIGFDTIEINLVFLFLHKKWGS